MTHNYVKPGKFKNYNCGYALVDGIVFPSVYAAESYCTRNKLDVDAHIQADDPSVLAECKRIARTTLPVLRDLQAKCRRKWAQVRQDCDTKAAARDEAERKNELGWEVHQDWVLEAVGQVAGFYDCMKVIGPYIDVLENVLRK